MRLRLIPAALGMLLVSVGVPAYALNCFQIWDARENLVYQSIYPPFDLAPPAFDRAMANLRTQRNTFIFFDTSDCAIIGSSVAGVATSGSADPASILSSACRIGLEGVIAKRSDAPYSSRRTETWLKLKCQLRQEFVIAGYTDRAGSPSQVGSLLLGVHAPNGELVSVGSVGTGWDVKEAAALKKRLARIETDTPPFAAGVSKPGRWSKRVAGSERWVAPNLVAEVVFSDWTPDGQVRHASYVALRIDKPAVAIVRETAKQIGVKIPSSVLARADRVIK